jgi:hypothetical protein
MEMELRVEENEVLQIIFKIGIILFLLGERMRYSV